MAFKLSLLGWRENRRRTCAAQAVQTHAVVVDLWWAGCSGLNACSVLNPKQNVRSFIMKMTNFRVLQGSSSLLHVANCIFIQWPYWASKAILNNNPPGRTALLPRRLVPDDEHGLTGRGIRRESLLSVCLPLSEASCVCMSHCYLPIIWTMCSDAPRLASQWPLTESGCPEGGADMSG